MNANDEWHGGDNTWSRLLRNQGARRSAIDRLGCLAALVFGFLLGLAAAVAAGLLFHGGAP